MSELTNGIINTAFVMLYQVGVYMCVCAIPLASLSILKDLTKIYATYNDALINLLGGLNFFIIHVALSSCVCVEHFFEMKKTQCKEVIEVYRKFLVRQDQVYKFFKLAEVQMHAHTHTYTHIHIYVHTYTYIHARTM